MLDSGLASSLHLTVYAFDRIEVGPWWNYRRHVSPFTRLLVVEEGEEEVTIHSRTYVCKPGRLYLVPAWTPVDYVCRRSCLEYYAMFTAAFEGGNDLCAAFSFDWEQPAEPLHYELSRRLRACIPNFGLRTCDACDPNYNLYIWQTPLEHLSAGQVAMAQGVVRLLLAPFMSSAKPQRQRLRLTKVLPFIEANLDKPLSLAALAGQIPLDSTYFSDLFERSIGMRPVEYVRRRRLERARILLCTTDQTVNEIARLCGFDDAQYFSRVFRKEYGTTPGRMRH
jgi:AraC-like DNA-binding protein